MKQPEDTSTAELNLEIKRGRGRPALEHALTPAERAKRYRDAKRARSTTENKSDASQKQPETIPDYVSARLAYDWEEKATELQKALEQERKLSHQINDSLREKTAEIVNLKNELNLQTSLYDLQTSLYESAMKTLTNIETKKRDAAEKKRDAAKKRRDASQK